LTMIIINIIIYSQVACKIESILNMNNVNIIESFKRYLKKRGLKWTWQREAIVSLFFAKDVHVSTEELYYEIRKESPKVGYSTVYRTLRLLVEAGLALESRFGDGVVLFEQSHKGKHHDHLICLKCGKIIEFENSKIEEMQKEIAAAKGFQMESHKLEIYGYCRECRE